MLNPVSLQLRVGVDVGSRCHSVAIGLSDGSLLEEFDIPHTKEGFRAFFARDRHLCLANSYYVHKSPLFHRLVNPGGNGTIWVHG